MSIGLAGFQVKILADLFDIQLDAWLSVMADADKTQTSESSSSGTSSSTEGSTDQVTSYNFLDDSQFIVTTRIFEVEYYKYNFHRLLVM